MLNVSDRSMRQEQKRLRDPLSDDRNAQDFLKGFLGKRNDWKIDPLIPLNLFLYLLDAEVAIACICTGAVASTRHPDPIVRPRNLI